MLDQDVEVGWMIHSLEIGNRQPDSVSLYSLSISISIHLLTYGSITTCKFAQN